MKKFSISLLLFLFSAVAFAQSSYVPYNRDYYHLIDRFTIKYPEAAKAFHTTYKPVSREDLATFLNSIKENYDSFSLQDKFNFQYLMNDSWEYTQSEFIENDKSWWNIFYNQKSDFLNYGNKNSDIHINPVFDFKGGKDSETNETLYTNTRGAEIRGRIDNKIGFYSFVTTTEALFPEYVRKTIRYRRAFPNEGFYKEIEGSRSGWDLLHARGYFTFGLTKSIHVQAGYDKNFIGDGLRSMILSDFSSPYAFLKINTQVGPFQYTNMFAELTEDIIFANANPGDGDYPKKFWAFHRLGLNITPRFTIGLFESVMSESATLAYFNPIVFYRAVEQQEGSPDNVMVGLDLKYNVKNTLSIYGQVLLDEFVISALRKNDGDWRNRFGIQFGTKYYDAFKVSNLDLQAEINLARPYLYQSEFKNSYSNYRNPLANPIGSNFKELVLVARYQPMKKLYLTGKFIYTDLGEDFGDGVNYGGNVLADTDDKARARGNHIGQGANAKNAYMEARGSYMILHNVFIDLTLIKRNFNSVLDDRDLNSTTISGGLRWNLAKRQHEF